MNTIRSVGYGWGVLILAGGGAYAFAKRSIDADRAARAEADYQKKAMQRQLENSYYMAQKANAPTSSADTASNPSAEASHDPAPTRHAPETRGQEVAEKSKYEAAEPWKSRKGDRFS